MDLHNFKLEVSGTIEEFPSNCAIENTVFLSFSPSPTSNKLCQMWFPSVFRVVEHSSVEQLQRLQIDSSAQASTPRHQTCFVPFSQAMFEGSCRGQGCHSKNRPTAFGPRSCESRGRRPKDWLTESVQAVLVETKGETKGTVVQTGTWHRLKERLHFRRYSRIFQNSARRFSARVWYVLTFELNDNVSAC